MTYWIRQFFTRPQAHILAFAEVAITALFSLIPLIITAVMLNVRNAERFNYAQVYETALSKGQLFLYAYSLLGTVIWLAFVKWDREMHGPRRLLGLVAVVLSYPIVALFGGDPSISNIVNTTIINASWWTYGVFLFIYYLLLFYLEIDPPPPSASLASGSNRLQSAYKNLGGTP